MVSGDGEGRGRDPGGRSGRAQPDARGAAEEERRRRLAAALRDNLRKRKAKERAGAQDRAGHNDRPAARDRAGGDGGGSATGDAE